MNCPQETGGNAKLPTCLGQNEKLHHRQQKYELFPTTLVGRKIRQENACLFLFMLIYV